MYVYIYVFCFVELLKMKKIKDEANCFIKG